MLVRRLISAVIHNQKRRILTASRTSGERKSQTPLQIKSIAALLTRGLSIRPIVTRLLLRALSIHRLNTNNALLATNRINGALQYSVGMSPKDSPQRAADISEEQEQDTNSPENESNDGTSPKSVSSRLAVYEDQKSGKTLDSLREAYDRARKQGDSTWLDFADKSVYIYIYKGGGQASDSMAAFDLDGTLIKPKSNKRIPRSATDWDLFSVWTKIKLQQVLRENPARFVIFTNQNGIGLDIVPLEEVQQRIELVMKKLDIPCTVFMATEKDEFRKPRLGMFWLFMDAFNDSTRLDFTNSFYCGDAIGYPSHSDADIKFAQQLDLPFLTPEKFLRGVKPKLVG